MRCCSLERVEIHELAHLYQLNPAEPCLCSPVGLVQQPMGQAAKPLPHVLSWHVALPWDLKLVLKGQDLAEIPYSAYEL